MAYTAVNGTNGHARPPAILGANGRPAREGPGPEYGELALPPVMLFSSLLGSTWHSYWINRQDQAMRAGRKEALAMEYDCYLQGLLNERKYGTVSLKWRIEVDNERDPWQKCVKDGLTKVVKATPNWHDLNWCLLDGIWFGKQAQQVAYEYKNLPLPVPGKQGVFQPQKALVVKQHRPVRGDKIGFSWDGTPYVQIHGSEGYGIPKSETFPTNQGRAFPLKGTWRQRFIIHTHEWKDADFFDAQAGDSIFGVGIRSVLFWLNWLRQEGLAHVLDWVERTGLGVRLWYFQGGNPKSKQEVMEAARNYAEDKTNILIPRYGDQASEGVEYVDTASTGADLLLRIQEHIEEHIERYVIGQTLSSGTEGSGLGGTGVSDLHADTKSKIIAADAARLDDTQTRDFLAILCRWTYPWADFPVRIVREIDERDPEKTMTAVKAARELGADFKVDDVAELTGLPVPQEGDRTLATVAAENQAAKSAQDMQLAGMRHPGAQGQFGEEEDDSGDDEAELGDDVQQFSRDGELLRYGEQHRGQPENSGQFGPGGGQPAPNTANQRQPAQPKYKAPMRNLAVKTQNLMDYGQSITFGHHKDLHALAAKLHHGQMDGHEAMGFVQQFHDSKARQTQKAYGTLFKQMKAKVGDGPGLERVKAAIQEEHKQAQAKLWDMSEEIASIARDAKRTGTADVHGNVDSNLGDMAQDLRAFFPQSYRRVVAAAMDAGAHFARWEEPERYGFDPNQKRDDAGKWTEGGGPHSSALSSMAHGDLKRVGGWMTRRTGEDSWRIDTDEGHVEGDAGAIHEHIGKHDALAKLEGRKYHEALTRGQGAIEPDVLQGTGNAPNLPHGSRVVSLHPETHGRVGTVHKTPEGAKVKLDNEPGWASGHVEPLDEGLSWRNKKDRAYSDQDKSWREMERVHAETIGEPEKASAKDLTLTRGYLGALMEHEKRRHTKGETTKEQYDGIADSLSREADHIDRLYKDRINGRSAGPQDQTRAQKIAERAVAEERSSLTVAKEMGLTLDEFRDLRPEVEQHVAEFRKTAKGAPSPARAKAMARAKELERAPTIRDLAPAAKPPAKPKVEVEEESQGNLYGDTTARQGKLFQRGEPERFDKGDKGHWVTIGGQNGADGKRHGGSPVYIENGIITKGHPRLTDQHVSSIGKGSKHVALKHKLLGHLAKTDNLQAIHEATKEHPRSHVNEALEELHKSGHVNVHTPRQGSPRVYRTGKELTEQAAPERTHRQQMNQAKAYTKAVWAKKARQADIKPDELHALAGEVLAHDKEMVADRVEMLKDARRTMDEFGGAHRTLAANQSRGGTVGDHTTMRGIDQAAQELQSTYPHLFSSEGGDPEEQLYEMLKEGNPTAMSEDDAYEQAFEHLQEHAAATVPPDDDAVPFERPDEPDRYEAWAELERAVEHELFLSTD